jgi:hypothetical protein
MSGIRNTNQYRLNLDILVLTRSQDILTGDEMISDVYQLKEVDGILYEADCQMITVKKGADAGTFVEA